MTIAEEVYDEVNTLPEPLTGLAIDAIFYSRRDEIETIRREDTREGLIVIFTDNSVFRLREDEGGVIMETGIYIPPQGDRYVH